MYIFFLVSESMYKTRTKTKSRNKTGATDKLMS